MNIRCPTWSCAFPLVPTIIEAAYAFNSDEVQYLRSSHTNPYLPRYAAVLKVYGKRRANKAEDGYHTIQWDMLA